MNTQPPATALRERQLSTLRAREARPALLIVDVQRSFGDPAFIDSYELGVADAAAVESAVNSCLTLVEAARTHGVEVIWIGLASEPDKPWTSSSWLLTGALDETPADSPCVVGTPGAEWYRVAPASGELQIAKRGYSGFHDTGLRELLAERGITWVAVAGLTTECCVAATAMDAFQSQLPVVLVTDASAAYETRIHDAAVEQLALNAALPLTVAELDHLWTTTGEKA